MDILVLKDYYQKRNLSEKETAEALSTLKSFQQRREEKAGIEDCTVSEMKEYITTLTEKGNNTTGALLALARAAYLSENRELYIYFTQIVERDSIMANLKAHMVSVLGEAKTASLFSDLRAPRPGAPPEEAISFTGELLLKMEKKLSPQECRSALTANAHGIPPEAFSAEAEHFQKSVDILTYLDDFHKRSVATLQEHADTGKVWFEQIITQDVVDYVKNHKEVLGGVYSRGKIYWTKIPYDMEAWLKETDKEAKRYYACHCPMAREVLRQNEVKIPRMWCNCTSGYIRQRFNAIFGEEVTVDLLETVLDGEDRCRFAIHVPESFRP